MADDTHKSGADALRSQFVEPLKAAGEQMRAAGQQAAAGTQAINAKVLDHVEANMREAIAALRKAASAGSVTDVMKAQGDYVQEQGRRSMEQAKEIGELIASFGKQAMAMTGLGPRGEPDNGGAGTDGGTAQS